MERRTFIRSPIRLNADIIDSMKRSWAFVIENFGFDGLLLKWNEKTTLPESFKTDDLLDVNFSIKYDGTINTHQLKVKIVRIFDKKLAVTLFNPALDSLAELSKRQQSEGLHRNSGHGNCLDKKTRNTVEAIKQSFLKNLSQSTEIFLPIAHDSMFHLAEKSTNNSDQARYFDAINTLEKSKIDLKSQLLGLIDKKLNLCDQINQSMQDENNLGELDLIDQNEFENWLTVNQLIINISPHYEQELLEIELRLSKLLGAVAKQNDFSPFSPEMIFKSFSEVIHNYFLSNDILLVLYQQFEKVIDTHLFDIYKEINQIFIDNNVLPLIEKEKLKPIKESNSKLEPLELIDLPESNKPAVVSEPPVVNTRPVINKPSIPHDNPVVESSRQNSHGNANMQALPQANNSAYKHMTEIDTIKNEVNLVPTYQTLKELLTFQNNQEFKKIPDEFFSSQKYKKQLTSLINILTIAQKKQAVSVSKGEFISVELGVLVRDGIKKEKYSIELINEFEYTFDVIKRLFQSIEQDQWLGKPVKRLLSLLQIPLLKVALLHKDFFESWSNPARIVINKLAMVDFDDEKNHFYIKARSFVLYLLKNFEQDLQIFSKIQEVLTQLLEIQSNHYNKDINGIIKNWDAQQVVTNEFASRLSGRSIPVVLADFISYQWLPILVSTYLKKGQDSSQWSQYLQALDMLVLIMAGDISEEFIDREVILFIIKQGLDDNGQYKKKIMDDIEHFLKEGDAGNEEHNIVLNLDVIIKLLINGYALSDKSAISKISKGSTDARAQSNIAIAKRLKVNDYLVYQQKEKSKLTRLQYVWGSDGQNLFVFAGRSGQQEAVFNLMEVASMLENGQLSQTKDYDLPLLERSLYDILGDVHDNIAKESYVDKVTGLMKRQEFERLFRQQLELKKLTGPECALCLIDIDQFSLINDTCGYEAGDQYLNEIAQVIKQNIPSEAIAARYGIDEFVLMLPNINPDEAQVIAHTQRKAINDYRFCWEDKDFTLNASIGLVLVPEYNDVAIFLKAVVTATTMAKEMGRNRVHLLEYNALELNHRQELQLWATKIDKMVENSQLDIRCQRLHPLHETLNPHYEMLLLVKDEQGNNTPPGEFIEAAELYNKMAYVDRWVIHSVLDWYSNHPEQLEKMGGVAINLSGHSLNDVDFLLFIQGVFEQYSVPPERVCFEITETVAITNLNHAINTVHSIKELGCEFSLDDFGTGLSSYAYLKNLPVDYLKIDGVFIKDIINNKADQAMVKSINELGHFLGMKTVAEFVENKEIMDMLKEIGVDYAQGYGVEKPFLMSES